MNTIELPSKTRCLILWILSSADEISSLDIFRRLNKGAKNYSKVSKGSLYGILNEFHRNSLVNRESRAVKGKKGEYWYSLTPEGKKLIAEIVEFIKTINL